jgi:putative ABC transport system substrate-binding protein
MQALWERLRELGYSEGKNMTFEYRSAEGHPERLPQLAMELVQARPDVLLTDRKSKRPFSTPRRRR